MPGDVEAGPRGRSGPVALAHGSFHGEDGHDGTGTATVVETPGRPPPAHLQPVRRQPRPRRRRLPDAERLARSTTGSSSAT